MITIINYGMGNLGSLTNMFKRIGVNVTISSDIENIETASKLILPGVGAFDAAMACINNVPNLKDVLNQKVLNEKIPILGICLGMQLLTNSSDEGKLSGFGWIPGSTVRFPHKENLKVPHMGWNFALPTRKSELTKNIDSEARYYFVHSYCVKASDPSHSFMKTYYDIEFDSAIGYDNIYGVQFHPEKSHRFGMQILKNFAEL